MSRRAFLARIAAAWTELAPARYPPKPVASRTARSA